MRDLQAIKYCFQINLSVTISFLELPPHWIFSLTANFKKCLFVREVIESLEVTIGEAAGFIPTRYRSVDTLTRIRSSPMRTFSPSDLCLDAGWIVHQHASPAQTEPRSSFNYRNSKCLWSNKEPVWTGFTAHLLNDLVDRRRTTACLSGSVMSSNRSGTGENDEFITPVWSPILSWSWGQIPTMLLKEWRRRMAWP